MNKQEAIEEIENAIPDFLLNDFQRGKETGLSYALELVNQLDELEKPVVPKFVADWYEDVKDDFYSNLEYRVWDVFESLDENNCVPERLLADDFTRWYYNTENAIQIIVNMHQFGYEVEKEKLYTVELPNTNIGGHVVLRKTGDGRVAITLTSAGRWRGVENAQLTESEIKKDFEWAWQFAEEVEE